MMPDRKMFWRIIWRIFASNRARLFVILLALGAGAAVTAALALPSLRHYSIFKSTPSAASPLNFAPSVQTW
jgi:hypothetical protein